MRSRIMSRSGETVTVVRLSADKDEETIIASGIVCLIRPVEGQYEYWKASLEKANGDILKGDILRRDDGSELQVLRVISGKGPRAVEKTLLDLKDYDRQEPPLQENELDMSKSEFLPEHQLHPIIVQKVWAMFLQGNYDPAVLQAFKQVEIAVREAGGYPDTAYGIDLMRKAFNVDNGNLTDEEQPPAEKQARSDLFAGAIGAYKNPGSHRDIDFTAEEAVELLFFASYLLRVVDSRKQPEED